MKVGTLVAKANRRGGLVRRIGPRPGRALVRWAGGQAQDERVTVENVTDLFADNQTGHVLLREVA